MKSENYNIKLSKNELDYIIINQIFLRLLKKRYDEETALLLSISINTIANILNVDEILILEKLGIFLY